MCIIIYNFLFKLFALCVLYKLLFFQRKYFLVFLPPYVTGSTCLRATVYNYTFVDSDHYVAVVFVNFLCIYGSYLYIHSTYCLFEIV